MVLLSHQMKQDTSIINILHSMERIIGVSLGFLYKQFKNMNNKQPPWRAIYPHTVMATQLVKKFLAFQKT
jgi:hypothetical protein